MKQRTGLVVSALALSILACQVGPLRLPTGPITAIRGSGNVVEEDRAVSGFTGLTLASFGNLTIEVGQTESLLIAAEDNLMEYLETEVHNGMLEIQVQRGVNLNPTRPVRFYVTVKKLDTITVLGSGDVEAPDLEASRFSVTISGSGDVGMGKLTANTLDVSISGSGSLEVTEGQVARQDVVIDGSGDCQTGDLSSESVEVTINGSGNVTVWATETLDVRVMGSGSVEYYGNPTVTFSGPGSGRISSLGDR